MLNFLRKWLFPLSILVAGLVYWWLVQRGTPVIFPVVQLPAEHIFLEPYFYFLGQGIYLVNTLPSFILTWVLVLILGIVAGNAARKRLAMFQANPQGVDAEGNDYMVPKGWHNTFEAVIEGLYGLCEQVIGAKWAPRAFPLVMTIFFFLVTANWLHFLPITDAVGIVHCADPEKGKSGYDVREYGNSGIYELVVPSGTTFPSGETSVPCPEHHEGAEGEHEEVAGLKYVITPFVRTAATDINLTLAFALIAVAAIQYFGVAELGLSYFTKFLNFPALRHGALGAIEFLVGLLESVGEVLRIVSFALRLLGNILAGVILLFVMAYLVPALLSLPFYFLEILVGFLQAIVFAMLTMVFISVAQSGHGDHGDEHAEDHHGEPGHLEAAGAD